MEPDKRAWLAFRSLAGVLLLLGHDGAIVVGDTSDAGEHRVPMPRGADGQGALTQI